MALRGKEQLLRTKEALALKTQELSDYATMLRATLESATDAILITDERGLVVGANQRYFHLWQLPTDLAALRGRPEPEEILSKWCKDPLQFRERLAQIAASSASETIDVIELADERIVERTSRLQTIGDRKVGRVWTFRDITRQKNAGDSVDRLAEYHRLALDSAQLGWWHYDVANGRVTWDERFKSIFGVTSEKSDYDSVMSHVHPSDRQRVDAAVRGSLRADSPSYSIEYRVIHNDGSVRWVLANGKACFEEDGKGGECRAATVVGTVADITERKRLEGALAAEKEVLSRIASGEPFATVLDTLVRGVETQSDDEMICSVLLLDEAGERLRHGAAPSLPEAYNRIIDGAAIGPRVGSCGSAAYKRQPVFATDISTDPHWADHRELAGTYNLGACCSTPIFASDGTLLGTMAMYYRRPQRPSAHDQDLIRLATKLAGIVIERARTEEKLRAAKSAAEEANKAKDNFIAVVSHELRTPLTPALAEADYLVAHEGLPPAIRDGLIMIRRNVQLEARLIDDLLDLTRMSRGKIELHLETVDAHALLANALAIVHESVLAKRIELSTELAAEAHCLSADPVRIQQVFWNLTTNAVKFTPEGGRISIRTFNDDEGRFVFEVTDSGIGIEPEQQARIFQPFEQGERAITRSFGGLGLGLTIAKTLADLHRGTITVHSAGRNQGTTFKITLDVVKDAPPATGRPLPKDRSPQCSLRLLLVEDHLDTLRTLSELLRRRGHEVTTADRISIALQLLDTQRFDVIVTDVGLPDGDGRDLVRGAKERQPLKAIALSGFGMEDDRRFSMEAGCDFHLTKPVNFQQLESTLQQICL